jgi:hypothetical protein
MVSASPSRTSASDFLIPATPSRFRLRLKYTALQGCDGRYVRARVMQTMRCPLREVRAREGGANAEILSVSFCGQKAAFLSRA